MRKLSEKSNFGKKQRDHWVHNDCSNTSIQSSRLKIK